MAKYLSIKRKIRSVKSTRQITKAMELVAGSRLRRAQQRLEATRPYQSKLHEIIDSLAGFQGEIFHPLLEGREVKTRGLIVLASDRGLCGAYNTNLFRATQKWIKSEKKPVKVITVGRRARDYFRRQNANIMESFEQPGQELELYEIRPIANRILDSYYAGEIDSMHLVYAKFRSALVNIPTVTQLVPIKPPESGAGSAGSSGDVIFEPEPKVMLSHLLPRVVMMELVGYLAESFTSEQGARMVAMQNATKNADEMIDWLTLQFNRARQTSITQEILEVVSGANALAG